MNGTGLPHGAVAIVAMMLGTWTGCARTGNLSADQGDAGTGNREGALDTPLGPIPAQAFLNLIVVGGGAVRTLPSGTVCTGACVIPYAPETQLQLEALAGGRFVGWTGVCAGTDPCAVRMHGDQDVTATFVLGRTVWNTPTGHVDFVVPSAKDVLVAGTFAGTTDFGGVSLTTGVPMGSSLFVAKYDGLGKLSWIKQGDVGSQDDGLTVAPNGDVLLAGICDTSDCQVAGVRITGGADETNPFIMRLSPTGDVLWIYQDRATFQPRYSLYGFDKAGRLAVATWSPTSPGALVILDENGRVVRSTRVLDGDITYAGIDRQDNLLVFSESFGQTQGAITLDLKEQGPRTFQSSDGTLLVKFDPQGVALWATGLPRDSAGLSGLRGMLTDDAGDIYMLAAGSLNKFRAADGKQLWSKSHGLKPGDRRMAMVADNAGELLIATTLPRISELDREFSGGPDLAGRPFISQGAVARYEMATGAGTTLALTIDGPVQTLAKGTNGDLFFATDFVGQKTLSRLWRVTPE